MSESESLVCPNCSERSPGGYILCPYCGFDLTKIVRERQRVRITFRERFNRIWRSLYDPRLSKSLFHEIGVNPDRLGAFFVVYLLSVAYATRLPVLVFKGGGSSSLDLLFLFILISPWIVGIGFIILAFFGWLFCGFIIWLIATRLGGRAGFRDTLGIVGYSFGPLITASICVNLVILVLGPPIGTVSTTTWTSFTIFEILYIPFIALAAYHCGNGISTAHLLREQYSYVICGIVAIAFALFYLLPSILA
ncbi:MAG: Yip1 family protein [Candidatus Hermodarchaeota archaeon]